MSSKVEPFKDSEKEGRSEMRSVLNWLVWGKRLCGVYIEHNADGTPLSKTGKVVMVVYAVFCNVCALFNAVRFLMIYTNLAMYSASLINSIAYTTFNFTIATSLLLTNVTASTHMKKFVEAMLKRSTENRRRSRKLRTATRAVVCFAFITGGFLHASRAILQGTTEAIYPRFSFPFDLLKGTYAIFGTCIDAVAAFHGCVSFYVLLASFNIISICIIQEFGYFSSKFKSYCNGASKATTLVELWNEHGKLCEIMEHAHRLLQHFVAICFLSTMPIFCFLVYGLIRGKLPQEEFAFVALIFGLCVLEIIDITLIGIFINDKAHEPLQHLFNSKWNPSIEQHMDKVSLFVARLSFEKIGYSIYGLLTLDRSAVLMICGTVLTYAIVVLQLQTDDRCGDSSLKTVNLTAYCSQI